MKLAAFTAIFLLLTSFGATAEMYKYIDENGQVVYTQFRPGPGVEAETIRGPAPPPSSAKATRQELIDDLVNQAETREDRKAAEIEAEQEKTRNNQLKQNCEAARKNLEYLQGQDKRTLVDSDGKAIKMSDAQRQQQIKKAREIVEQDCK
jgi:hypothetical protein